jgi:hypothetical protein
VIEITFGVSNKKLVQMATIDSPYIFSSIAITTILTAATLFEFDNVPFSIIEETGLFGIHQLLLGPATELVQAGKKSGGASGEIARSPATSMHWKRRTLHVQPQLQPRSFAHSALMPRRIEYHFHIQLSYSRQIGNFPLDI